MDPTETLKQLGAEVRRLQDRLDIIEILGRYGRALDELDWDELRTLISADVVARHDAVAPPFTGIDTLFAVIQSVQPRLKGVQHFVANQHVELHAGGQRATAYAYIFAMHDTGANLIPAGGAYRMDMVRADTPHRWQIAAIDVDERWSDANIAQLFDADSPPPSAQ